MKSPAEISTLQRKFRRLRAQHGVCLCPTCENRRYGVGIKRLVLVADAARPEHFQREEKINTDEASTVVVFKSPVSSAPDMKMSAGPTPPKKNQVH